jgi:hypothetical protein
MQITEADSVKALVCRGYDNAPGTLPLPSRETDNGSCSRASFGREPLTCYNGPGRWFERVRRAPSSVAACDWVATPVAVNVSTNEMRRVPM